MWPCRTNPNVSFASGYTPIGSGYTPICSYACTVFSTRNTWNHVTSQHAIEALHVVAAKKACQQLGPSEDLLQHGAPPFLDD